MINDELVDVFKALSHPIRIDILDHLKKKPLTTGEISEKYDVSRYAIMKHLSVLVEAKLVLIRRKGRTRLNYINVIPLQELYNRWVSKYEAPHAIQLLQLKNLAEEREVVMEQTKGSKVESFEIEQEVVIQAKKETVYKALTDDINRWWKFRVGGEDSKLIFEPFLTGRFYEEWGNGGEGALWGSVTYLKENEEIRLNGLLGMSGAVNSSYSYKLKEDGNQTILQLSHQAVGILEPHWEEAHRHGWNELLSEHLKNFVEQR